MITFQSKDRVAGQLNPYDVVVSYPNRGKNRKTIRFSLSQKAKTMIVGREKYIIAGTDEKNLDRIYFSSANSTAGYKLSVKSNSGCERSYFSPWKIPYITPTDFLGNYNLRYDKDNKLFYIDKKFKQT